MVMPRFDCSQLQDAVAKSFSCAEALRRLNFCQTGGNHETIKRYCAKWNISTSHFLTRSQRARKYLFKEATPLASVLTEHSTYSRRALKARLFKEGLKERVCEMCGQDETWRGKPMPLILDHINGVRDDNRITNLRIVCPDCNATLDTHWGKRAQGSCSVCNSQIPVGRKYCSRSCYLLVIGRFPKLNLRKVKRPTYKRLLREVAALGFSATGRKYGVSDQAIRKWIKTYETYGQ